MRVLVLLTAIIFLALSPTIGAEAVNHLLGYREQENGVRQAALATVQLRNSELERVVNGIETLLGNASRIAKLDRQAGPSCEGLNQLLINSPMKIVLAAADRTGRVVCSSTPIEYAVQISDRGFFRSTVTDKTFVIGGYVRSRLNDRGALVFGYPVRDDDSHEVIGAVLAYLDLDWLSVTLENARLLPGQKLTVTDQNGVVLADLWITRNIAEALGHELHVRSVVSKGSCFQVIVTLAQGVASTTKSPANELGRAGIDAQELAA